MDGAKMNTKGIKQAEKLIKDVHTKIDKWNERSQFKVKGVGNLSRSDMDTLEYYAETFIKNGGYGFPGLLEPLGNIREVFVKYEMIS